MCGICGFNYENKSLLKKMCDSIIHRGPDDVGYYTNSSVSLGMRRLSIIDLQTGHQPQHNEEEDIWIVFNGEIYNFQKLRSLLEIKGHKFYTNSDTEVVIHAYEEWGNKCLNKFRGQFSFCIYDSKKQILFFARDPVGLKPLYYYFDGDKFIFGSEIKCILLHDIERKVNKRALNYYLTLLYVPFHLTLFKGIFKLPPSSYLIFNLKNKQLKIKKYWNIKFNINRVKNDNQFAKELKALIEDSINIRLISEVPLGAFLSGGIDSSAVVGVMSKLMDEPVKTFSIGFEEDIPEDETKYSQFIADYFNTDHTELTIKSTCYEALPKLVWHLDDLISDPAIISVYYMAKLAREELTVALTGDGADEIFSGYSHYYGMCENNLTRIIPKSFFNPLFSYIMKYYNIIPSHKLQFILSYISLSRSKEDRFFRSILTVPDIDKHNMVPFKTEIIKDTFKQNFIKNLDLINQQVNFNLKYQLSNNFNMKTDKMSMAASLEARAPFLDQKIINWSLSIPSELKLKGTTEKYILKLAMKDILPPQILKRKKQGFIQPLKLWFQKGMKEISEEILERLVKRKMLINPNYVNKVKRNRFNKLYRVRCWNLIMFELWYETFIENKIERQISL